jgi:hypothetical protein
VNFPWSATVFPGWDVTLQDKISQWSQRGEILSSYFMLSYRVTGARHRVCKGGDESDILSNP